MRHDFGTKRNVMIGVLATLLAADIAMIAYSIRVDSSADSSAEQLTAQTTQLRLLTADVRRAREIQQSIP